MRLVHGFCRVLACSLPLLFAACGGGGEVLPADDFAVPRDLAVRPPDAPMHDPAPDLRRVCNPTTCPDGCCDPQGTCQTPSVGQCGLGGVACVACDVGISDRCSTRATG